MFEITQRVVVEASAIDSDRPHGLGGRVVNRTRRCV
nr:MAG TPA: hypothetical protein [Caudoviricetes sp.]